MRYGLIIAILNILSGVINPIKAQHQKFKNYTVNEGLASNTIRKVYQDSKGFLWIAALEGLSKYDGHTFTNYTTANGLSHNMVNDLYEDENERLYIALNNGAIDMLTGNKVSPKTIPGDIVINQFIKLSTGILLASTDRNGLQEIDDGKIRQPKHHFSDKTFTNIFQFNDSLIIALEETSIKVYNNKYELIAEINNGNIINIHSTIYQDSKKRIWVSTISGLQLLNISQLNGTVVLTLSPIKYNIPILKGIIINDIFEDSDGVMWFATSGGLVKINPDETHQRFTAKDGLPSNIVNSIFQDKENNLWFGTAAGLSKLVTRQSITLYPMKDAFFENNYSYLLHPFKKNHFLVGSFKSTKIFNTITEKFTAIENSGAENYYDVVLNSKQTKLLSYHKISVFDSARLKFTKTDTLPEEFASRIISYEGGYFFSSPHKQLIFKSGDIQKIILNYRISALLVDKNGDLWAGTWQNGLFRIKYNFSNNRLNIISTQHFLPTENIRSLFEDSKGNIWVGTRYQGVYQLRKKTKDSFTIENFDQKKGLTSNFVKVIREDAHGNYWIAFYQGIDKLIVNNDGYRIFNFSRINNYFATIIGMETDHEHTLWLATNDGLVKVKDGEMERLPPLPVYITKAFSPDSIYSITGNKLELNHRQNQLQFEFSSPGFINESQLLYSYRLKDGDSTDWSQPSNQHFVSYASLQPGHYNFEVRTMGWNGQWGTPANFEFVISPPYWQTWWFATASALGIISVTIWLVRRRIKHIRREAELKHKMAEAEMAALRAQMNPHFIFNCLNAIDNLVQTNQKEKATTYLAKFAKLIRSVLDSSKNNSIGFQKDYESLRLYLQMEQFRCSNKFEYELIADEELLQSDYKVPPLIVQPFVENAIHHGLLNKLSGERKLTVIAALENDCIKYTITDNGIGRTKAQEIKVINKPEHESYGINITTERIHLYNKNGHANGVTITDLFENNKPSGTKVEVRIKMNETN